MATTNRSKNTDTGLKKPEANQPQVVIQQITLGQLHQLENPDIGHLRAAQRSANNITLSRRKRLYEIYEEALLDDSITSGIQKRENKLTNSPLRYVNQEGEEDPAMKQFICSPWFSDLLKLILHRVWYGFVVIEPKINSRGEIIEMRKVPPHHVMPDKRVILVHDVDTDGIKLDDSPYAESVLAFGGERDLGLLLKASFYALLKRGLIADWAQFAQMFGIPIREYTYNPNDPTSRIQVEEQAKAAGSAAYVIHPEGSGMNIHKAADASNSSVFKDFEESMDKKIMVLFLGQTLTSSTQGVGSQALGRVHSDQQEDIHLADMIMTEQVLNYTATNFLRYWGLPIKEGYAFRYDHTEQVALEKAFSIDGMWAKMLNIPAEHFYKKYGYPVPPEGASWKDLSTQAGVDPTATDPLPNANRKPTDTMKAILAEYRKEILGKNHV